MLLGTTATIVVACFCVSPAPLPEQIPVAPDAVTTIHDTVRSDAFPARCLRSARAWSHLADVCPSVPSEPFIKVGAKPFLLYRAR